MNQTTDDEWGGALPGVPSRPIGAGSPITVHEDIVVEACAEQWLRGVQEVADGIRLMDTAWMILADGLATRTDADGYAAASAALATLKSKLSDLDASISSAAGKAVRELAMPTSGRLPDGRPYEIKRGSERKAWNHAGWQGAVRDEVTGAWDGCQVLTSDGELLDAQVVIGSAVAVAQAAHGAGAPKVTVLKQRGIRPDDFCESTPGLWRVEIEPLPEP